MTRTLANLTMGLLFGMAAQAATTSTTLTVNANVSISLTSGAITADGTADLTGIGSGTFSGTMSSDALSSPTPTATFKITLGADTITGSLSIPASLITGAATSGKGSATITGGTGAYAGATGSFLTLNGTATGSILSGFKLTFTGPGMVTTGGGSQTPVPTITDVLDAGSYTPSIAQGSIFVVKGSKLSGDGFNQFRFPLPTSSDGVKITFTPTAGGTGKDAYLVYTFNVNGTNQLAALLPSDVVAGNYNVTVTAGGATSAPFSVAVVQRKIGLITQDSTGSGLAVVQNYVSASQVDVNRLTTGSVSGISISPAKPGQVLIAWATGMGAVKDADNVASPGFDFVGAGVPVRVVVGGVSITPVYAGRTPGLAGTDQINFQLPADIPTGCSVSLQISVNGVVSNATSIAIAPNASTDACVQPGYTIQQLKEFDNGKSITIGSFALTQTTISVPGTATLKQNAAGGSFTKITGFQLAAAAAASAQNPTTVSDVCQVVHSISSNDDPGVSLSIKNLDAGAITLTGPGASNIANLALKQDLTSNSYSLTLATEGLPVPSPGTGTITAGTYTLKGAGGKEVGAFNATLTLGTPISVTLPGTVNRSAGLTLNWTGGLATDIVQITGSSSTVTGSGANKTTDAAAFYCTTTAGKGTFTVPSSILTQLPPVSGTSTTGGGLLSVVSTPNPTTGNGTFTAPLTAGGNIDFGYFLGLVGTAAIVSYQ